MLPPLGRAKSEFVLLGDAPRPLCADDVSAGRGAPARPPDIEKTPASGGSLQNQIEVSQRRSACRRRFGHPQ
jgi:hypothetical protein